MYDYALKWRIHTKDSRLSLRASVGRQRLLRHPIRIRVCSAIDSGWEWGRFGPHNTLSPLCQRIETEHDQPCFVLRRHTAHSAYTCINVSGWMTRISCSFYGGLAGALIPDGDKWDPPSLTGCCGGHLPEFTATFRAAGSIVESTSVFLWQVPGVAQSAPP
jgi:hypothetical protein